MNEWNEFDDIVEACEDCGSLKHSELCPKHELLFENWDEMK